MDKLIEGLQYFKTNLLWQKRELFAECLLGQRPFAMLIASSNSRPLSDAVRRIAPRDLFIHSNSRTFGAESNWAADEAMAIEHAITIAGVTDLIVCGEYSDRAGVSLRRSIPFSPSLKDGSHCKATGVSKFLRRSVGAWAGKSAGDREIESEVLRRLKEIARHPAVSSHLRSGTVRLHGWTVCRETGEISTESPEHGRFVPLLEIPTIRGVSPIHRERRAVRPRCVPAGRFRNAGYLVTSALCLIALVSMKGRSGPPSRRIQGGPPSCACLIQGDNRVAPCSEGCLQATHESQPTSRIAADERMVACR